MNRLAKFCLLCFASVSVGLVSCRESLDDRITREAKDYTSRMCPKHLDQYVILDSITYQIKKDGVNEYVYHHTVDCDTEQMSFLKENGQGLREEILKNIRNAQDMRLIKNAGITIVYLFNQSGTGNPILDFRYTQAEYK